MSRSEEPFVLRAVPYSVFYPGRKRTKCRSFKKPTRDTKPIQRKHKGQSK